MKSIKVSGKAARLKTAGCIPQALAPARSSTNANVVYATASCPASVTFESIAIQKLHKMTNAMITNKVPKLRWNENPFVEESLVGNPNKYALTSGTSSV